jgi:hypothetical protein
MKDARSAKMKAERPVFRRHFRINGHDLHSQRNMKVPYRRDARCASQQKMHAAERRTPCVSTGDFHINGHDIQSQRSMKVPVVWVKSVEKDSPPAGGGGIFCFRKRHCV